MSEFVDHDSDVGGTDVAARVPRQVTRVEPSAELRAELWAAEQALPAGARSGEEAHWRLPTTRVTHAGEHLSEVLTIEARFLGIGSSRTERHWTHAGEFATRAERCTLCRWYETRIFRLGRNEYVLHHAGCTMVPGEVTFFRHENVFSPYEVLERYTARKPGENRAFLPRPAARALAQAVAFDPDLLDAYDNRAIL